MLVCKEFVHLWCAWNQGCTVSSSSFFPVMLFIDLLEHKAITILHKSWSSTYLAPFFQIACLLFHLKSSRFFCNKDLPGCLLLRNFAGVVQDTDPGGDVVRHAAADPGNPWSKGGLGHALKLPAGKLRAVYAWAVVFLGSVQPQNTVLDGIWHSLNAAAN